jgi:diadenosine tetraphosphate (Ap4A) HIT family hydrolase
VPTERLYVFSFGSNQGVAHVHWHLAPLPPGVPFEQQQFAAVTRAEQLVIPAHDQAALAEKINQSMSN